MAATFEVGDRVAFDHGRLDPAICRVVVHRGRVHRIDGKVPVIYDERTREELWCYPSQTTVDRFGAG